MEDARNCIEPANAPDALSISAVHAQLRFLKTEICTVIAAAIPNKDQLRAVNGLVERLFNDRANHITTICGEQHNVASSLPNNLRSLSPD